VQAVSNKVTSDCPHQLDAIREVRIRDKFNGFPQTCKFYEETSEDNKSA
jgi:trimethylamine:corrinoid methyltransferase-like protein